MDTPAPAPASTPTTGIMHQVAHHRATQAIVGDLIVGIVAAVFGEPIGRRIRAWLTRDEKPTTPQHPPGAPEEEEPAIKPTLFDWGLNDEAQMGLNISNLFIECETRLKAATEKGDADVKQMAEEVMRRLRQTVQFIRKSLTQHERERLKGATVRIKKTEDQLRYLTGLVVASDTEEHFLDFMYAQGVINELPRLTQELVGGITDGINGATEISNRLTEEKREKLKAKRQRLLQTIANP